MSALSLKQKLAIVETDILNSTARISTLENAPASIDATAVSNLQSSVSTLQYQVDELQINDTKFAFQSTSSLNGNQAMSSGVILNFNQRIFCSPLLVNYNTSNKHYIVQSDGIYNFGFKLYMSSTTNPLRIGIYKNGTLLAMGGATADVAESVQTLAQCSAGDLIDVRCESGTGNIYMANTFSWFYGYKI